MAQFNFDPQTIQRIRDQRRARRGQVTDNIVGNILGVEHRDEGTYMTGAQKAAAKSDIIEKIAKDDQFYYENAVKLAEARMEELGRNYRELLQTEQERLKTMAESQRLSAQLQTQYYDREMKRLEAEEEAAKKLDPATEALVKAYQTTMNQAIESNAMRAIETQYKDLVRMTDPAALRADPKLAAKYQRVMQAAVANGDLSEADVRGNPTKVSKLIAEEANRLASQDGQRAEVERIKLEVLAGGKDDPKKAQVVEQVRSAVGSILDSGLPPEQKHLAMSILGGDLGVRASDLARSVGSDFADRMKDLDQQVALTKQARLEGLTQVGESRLRASKATYASDAGLRAAQQAFGQAVEGAAGLARTRLGKDPLPAEPRQGGTDVVASGADPAAPVASSATVPGVDAPRAGAGAGGVRGGAPGFGGAPGAPGAPGASDGSAEVESLIQGLMQDSDAKKQYLGLLEVIDGYPDAPPAQYLRRQIMASPVYKQFVEERGYDGFDERKVWREFRQEGMRAARAQDEEFRRRRALNRSNLAPGGAAVVQGAKSPAPAGPEAVKDGA
jgi:hypothetical protein